MDLNEREPLPTTSSSNQGSLLNSILKISPFSSNLINFSLSLSHTHTHPHTPTHTILCSLFFSFFLGFHVTYTLPIIKLRENRGILGQEEQNLAKLVVWVSLHIAFM